MAVLNANDVRPRDRGERGTGGKALDTLVDKAMADITLPEKVDFLQVVKWADVQQQQSAGQRYTAWRNNLAATHNQHSTRSKYLDRLYANRSRLFRPKTRSSVRKNLAATAAAMFSTADVVSVKPEWESNPVKQASAAVWHEALNYRLDRTSTRSGIPWFLTCVGASYDAQQHGVCISKQYWEYETVRRTRRVPTPTPALDEATGMPVLDMMTGQPVMAVVEVEEEYDKIVRDRPMSLLIPPENVQVDETAPWYDPAQLSAYFMARFPMTLDEARTMLRNPGKSDSQWLDVPDDVLTSAAEHYDAKSVRIARERTGADRFERRSGAGGGDDKKHDVVWLQENFVRCYGEDYHFWTVGTIAYASKIRLTEESYPEQMGNRPYVWGYGSLESHTVWPMSQVESWQPLQQEANDIVNLQLDVMKQWAAPIAKVRQGRMFDWNSLQRRGAGGIDIIVRDPDDVEFDRPPEVAQSTYLQSDRINADMDDLSGTFSQGSVATNRAFNETVGGMRLLSGSANSVTEFDLRVWVETWTEVVLRQLVRLMQWYETDETILAVAGERAKLVERFGVNELTDQDLVQEASVRVNVGIGAADPFQRIQKLGMAMQMIGAAAPFFDKKKKLNGEELISEIMGGAGYADGKRFFVDDPEGGGPPPEVMMEMGKLEIQKAKLALDKEMNQLDNATKAKVAEITGRFDIIENIIEQMGMMQQAQAQQARDEATAMSDRFVQLADVQARNQTALQLGREKLDSTRQAQQSAQRTNQEKARMTAILADAKRRDGTRLAEGRQRDTVATARRGQDIDSFLRGEEMRMGAAQRADEIDMADRRQREGMEMQDRTKRAGMQSNEKLGREKLRQQARQNQQRRSKPNTS